MATEGLATAKLNPENHLILEQPLLKVPYQLSRKNLKTAQRHVERERDVLYSQFKSTTMLYEQPTPALSTQPHQNGHTDHTNTSHANALNSLDNMIHRMETLKRRLSSLQTEEHNNHRATKARIQHLQTLHDIPSAGDVAYDVWSKTRLNRLLVDYLLRKKYSTSASSFARATGIEDLVDIDAFVACNRIETSLNERRTTEALAWCAENRQSLKKMESRLEFELRLQQYIELVRTGVGEKLLEAAAHAKKHFAAGATTEPQRVVEAAGLLAFPEGTPFEPYKSLYSPTRWTHLSTLFTRTHHTLLSLPPSPALHVALSAGLSALKTPACHSIHASSSGNVSTATSGHSVCPICSTELNELARNVPYAHHTKSIIEDEPVVLPNFRIYGRQRLETLNEKIGERRGEDGWNGGEMEGRGARVVRDPMDPRQEDWTWDDVRKVYIS